MKCEVCNETELEGELGVFTTSVISEMPKEEFTLISLRETTRRNYIACDGCNKAVCHNCCEHPRSGYCDSCIEKYNLRVYLVEVGLIEQ
jgi:hypothetical protein